MSIIGERKLSFLGMITYVNVGCLYLLESMRRPPENEANTTEARTKSYEEREIELMAYFRHFIAPESRYSELFIYIR